MALSNWDLLAFNTQGKSCDGVMTYKNTTVEIYKNWAYISNDKMWYEDGTIFTKPVIAEIHSGNIQLASIDIVAERHEHQNSIFIICKGGYNTKGDMEIMCGIGCSGYVNTGKIYSERMNLDPSYDWCSGSSTSNGKTIEMMTGFHKTRKMKQVVVPDNILISFDDQWTGVDEITYKAFLEFIERVDESNEIILSKGYVNKIKKATPKRFNQGDRYFEKNLGIKIPKTKIGKSDKPVMEKIIKEW